MISTVLLAALATVGLQQSDSARRVGDTLIISPMGVRLTIPELWMGHVAPGTTGNPFAGGAPFACQVNASHGPVEGRIVTDPAQLLTIQQGTFGALRSYQNALDAVVAPTQMVAHVGGDRFDSSCLAPQIHIYTTDSGSLHPDAFGVFAQNEIQKSDAGVRPAISDSAGWHIVRFEWTENKTEFIHPATLAIWSRPIAGRLLVLGVMDAWTDSRNVNDLLASVRWLPQLPDSAVIHAAFRDAIVAVYRHVFTTEREANSVRVYLSTFRHIGNMDESTDLSDLVRAIGPSATTDKSVTCGAVPCAMISAEGLRASGDTLVVRLGVVTWMFPSHPDWFSGVTYEVRFVRREGKFTIVWVLPVAES